MDVFGQILHFTPLFIANLVETWNPSKYVRQRIQNGIKHVLNKF
jgi:hypothetical protein